MGQAVRWKEGKARRKLIPHLIWLNFLLEILCTPLLFSAIFYSAFDFKDHFRTLSF